MACNACKGTGWRVPAQVVCPVCRGSDDPNTPPLPERPAERTTPPMPKGTPPKVRKS